MSYTIHKSDGTVVTVADNAIDLAYYNATGGSTGAGSGTQLVGRNALDYGSPTAQNFLQLTENFASATGTFPSDSTALQGQLWFNKLSGTTGNLYVRVSGATSGGLANWQQVLTTGSSGVVSSVGMTVPSFLSVSGSPVTSSGTLAVTLSGTALPAANGGTDVTSPGASGNVLTSNGSAWLSAPPASGSGTVTSVSGTGTVNGLTLTGTVTTSGSLTLGGTLTLTSGEVTTALGYTPGTGSVTSASVVTANGFAGSVATATTTPAITLSTTITGLLKGNGTAISAATAGTDYVVPGSLNADTVAITQTIDNALYEIVLAEQTSIPGNIALQGNTGLYYNPSAQIVYANSIIASGSITAASLSGAWDVHSVATNGYAKLPGSGIIIQWGVSANEFITFPLTFPNAIFSISGSSNNPSPAASGNNVTAITTSGCTFYGYAGTASINWIAIGY